MRFYDSTGMGSGVDKNTLINLSWKEVNNTLASEEIIAFAASTINFERMYHMHTSILYMYKKAQKALHE